MAGTSSWLATETDFSDPSMTSVASTAKNDALYNSGLNPFIFNNATHLMVIDSIKQNFEWTAAPVFNGQFFNENGSSYDVPMIRLSEGVFKYIESGFEANYTTINEGGLTIITITPNSGTLKSFVAGDNLDSAIKNSINAALGKTPNNLTAGNIVLPAVSLSAPIEINKLILTHTENQAYNQYIANLKGLDGIGGTFVSLSQQKSSLVITETGLALKSAYAAEFVFSPMNFNGPVNSGTINSGSGPVITNSGSGGFMMTHSTGLRDIENTKCSPTPDLRSMFLVVVDSTQALLSVTAMLKPGGNLIQCIH